MALATSLVEARLGRAALALELAQEAAQSASGTDRLDLQAEALEDLGLAGGPSTALDYQALQLSARKGNLAAGERIRRLRVR